MSTIKRVSSPIYTFFPTEEHYLFETRVYLNGLDPDAVRVELYVEGVNGSVPVRKEMTRGRKPAGAEDCYVYGAQVQATRPATDYTARVIPYRTGSAVPLEAVISCGNDERQRQGDMKQLAFPPLLPA